MNRVYIIISVCIILLTYCNICSAQKKVKKDSTDFYAKLEGYCKKRKFTEFIYCAVFKPVSHSSTKIVVKKIPNRKKLRKPLSAYEGKIIRNIHIETLDPFGYSVNDTATTKKHFVDRAGNKLHIKSQNITIRNLILYRKHQRLDSLLIKESERLIRRQSYIHEVATTVSPVSGNSDSVDVNIRVLDNWSISPEPIVGSQSVGLNLVDENLGGLGHRFQNEWVWNHAKGRSAFNASYSIPNFRNTYISSKLNYSIDALRNYSKGISIDRPFFSPFAKWAAGVNLYQAYRKDSLNFDGSGSRNFELNYNVQDFWAGTAMPVLKGNSETERTTNLILAARYYRLRFTEQPLEFQENNVVFSNEDLYLGSVGISTRKYVQDKYIFSYGIIEDVPIGKVYSMTAGHQIRNNTSRMYLGLRYAFGNYYDWGYLSCDVEYGTFFRSHKAEQGNITIGLNYFTGLLETGKWKIRQFVKPHLVLGINQQGRDSINLNDGYGIDGFDSKNLSGDSRFVLTLQTQLYAPWNLIGFRFGPYFTYNLGMLGVEGFGKSKLYSQFGIGLLIKNENLILNTFQLSLSFYPNIPGIGSNVYKFNSFSTNDFGFTNFEISKPATAVYK